MSIQLFCQSQSRPKFFMRWANAPFGSMQATLNLYKAPLLFCLSHCNNQQFSDFLKLSEPLSLTLTLSLFLSRAIFQKSLLFIWARASKYLESWEHFNFMSVKLDQRLMVARFDLPSSSCSHFSPQGGITSDLFLPLQSARLFWSRTTLTTELINC